MLVSCSLPPNSQKRTRVANKIKMPFQRRIMYTKPPSDVKETTQQGRRVVVHVLSRSSHRHHRFPVLRTPCRSEVRKQRSSSNNWQRILEDQKHTTSTHAPGVCLQENCTLLCTPEKLARNNRSNVCLDPSGEDLLSP